MQTEYLTSVNAKRDLLKILRFLKDRCYLITQQGKPEAVLMSYEEFAKLGKSRLTGYELARRRKAYQHVLERQKKFQKVGADLQKVLTSVRNKQKTR
jgi:prevent-host-death family protein